MEKVMYKGKIIEVVETEKNIPNSNKIKTFEFARRSPGVRAIIVKDGMMLLSKEYRYELNDFDYRLPGGKVFDTLDEFKNHIAKDLSEDAEKAVVKECFEEVGIKVKNPKLLQISKAGATIDWDLYYFEVTEFENDIQHLEEGEIISFSWFSFEEVIEMCLANKIFEDRSVGVILKYILKSIKK